MALVELLLRAGADARAHGRPALEAAAARGYAAVVKVLLAAGADPAACNSSALVAASIQVRAQAGGPAGRFMAASVQCGALADGREECGAQH